MICWELNLSAEVDDARVGVVEGQKDAAAGVQFLQVQGLPKVILLEIIETGGHRTIQGIRSNPATTPAVVNIDALARTRASKQDEKFGASTDFHRNDVKLQEKPPFGFDGLYGQKK